MHELSLETILLLGSLGYIFISTAALYFFFWYSPHTRHSWKYWWLCGTLYNFWSIAFFYSGYPLSWTSSHGLQLLGFTIFLGVNAIGAGATFVLIGEAIRRWQHHPWFLVLLGITGIASTLLRSLILSFINLGPTSSIGFHLIPGSLGQALAYTPLVIFSYGGGVYILSGIFIVLVWMCIHPKRKEWIVVSILLLLWAWVINTVQFTPPPRLSIGIVTTSYVEPESKAEIEVSYFDRTRAIANAFLRTKENYDIIALPESTQFLEYSAKQKITVQAPTQLLIDSGLDTRTGKSQDLSLFHEPNSGTTTSSGKQYPMPASEYTPYMLIPIAWIISSPSEFKTYMMEHNAYLPATERTVYNYHNTRIATLLCSEGTSFTAHRHAASLHPDLVLLQSNLSVFKNKFRYYMEILSYARIVAATLNRPVLSASNDTLSLIISRHGNTVAALPRANALYTFEINGEHINMTKDPITW